MPLCDHVEAAPTITANTTQVKDYTAHTITSKAKDYDPTLRAPSTVTPVEPCAPFKPGFYRPKQRKPVRAGHSPPATSKDCHQVVVQPCCSSTDQHPNEPHRSRPHPKHFVPRMTHNPPAKCGTSTRHECYYCIHIAAAPTVTSIVRNHTCQRSQPKHFVHPAPLAAMRTSRPQEGGPKAPQRTKCQAYSSQPRTSTEHKCNHALSNYSSTNNHQAHQSTAQVKNYGSNTLCTQHAHSSGATHTSWPAESGPKAPQSTSPGTRAQAKGSLVPQSLVFWCFACCALVTAHAHTPSPGVSALPCYSPSSITSVNRTGQRLLLKL